MIDRKPPNAATDWGASLMTQAYAVPEAGSSPRSLAVSIKMTQGKLCGATQPENPGSKVAHGL